jgi:hypothetical protein
MVDGNKSENIETNYPSLFEMLNELDTIARKLNISRQAVIKMYLGKP